MRIFVMLLWIVGSIFATPLLKTGQTLSYDSNGNVVSDGSIKDDGFYQRGVTRSCSRSGDIVIDAVTGLQWSDSESVAKPWITQASYSVHEFDNTSGDTAVSYCESLQLGGYGDWRLPSVQEWETITDDGWLDESLPMKLFQNYSTSPYHNMYWTSTGVADYSPWAWNIDIDHINLGQSLETNIYNVRCVRGEALDSPVLSRSGEIVTDTTTNLQWQDNEAAETEVMNVDDAIDYCENMNLGEWSDWRLPNKKELLSIVDYSQAIPAIDDSVFVNVFSGHDLPYVSSTTLYQAPGAPWSVDFRSGGKGMNGFWGVHVRCVRGGDVEDEMSLFKNEVAKLYVATFNRAPDAAGLNYWVYDSGLEIEKIAQSFFDQPETQSLYAQGFSNIDFVEAVYHNLFNRSSDQAGLDYWVGELDSGRIARSVFILAVINGAQNTETYGNDRTILTNKTTIGLAFANAGLNDTAVAKEIMSGITDDEETVTEALSSYGIGAIEQLSSFTLDYLNEKTLYYVQYNDFGYDDMKWNMARMDFAVNTLSWTEYDTVETETHTFNYTVNPEGNIILDYDGGHQQVISFDEISNDYIKVCTDGDCNTYLFFDEEKARAFRESHNNIVITEAMLNGKTFYGRESDANGEGYSVMTFTATEGTRHEIWYNEDSSVRGDETFTFTIALIDGKIDVVGFDMRFKLINESSDTWEVIKEKFNDDNGIETWYLSKPADFSESL